MPPRPLILMVLAAAIAAVPARSEPVTPKRNASETLTLERVARYPPPGRRQAGTFRFGHDGRYLYFLAIEGDGISRSLSREDVTTGAREVVARPPREDGAAALTPEEVLRRERQRIQDAGITQYHLAAAADVAVFDWRGDVWLARPGDDPLRLTETASSEIGPRLSPDGTRVAYARDGDLYVLDIRSRRETRLTTGARDGVFHGEAEYIAQEEMDRDEGFWWSPDGTRLAYTEVDETAIPPYPVVHQGGARWEVESSRYPFAGGPNARVRLGVVPAAGGATVWIPLAGEDEDVYLARVRFDLDGMVLAQVESRDQKSLRLLRADPRTGKATRLLEDRSDTWINLHDDLRPLGNGRFLWSGESTGWRHLELRAADGSLVRRLTSGDWAVDAVEGVDEAAGLVYFTATKDGPRQRLLYRVPLEGGPVERVGDEGGWHTVTASHDTSLFVDVRETAASMPQAWLRDGAGRSIRVLDANTDPEPGRLALRPPESVTLRAADGTTLYGAVYKPEPFTAGRKYPALVRVYGGPTAQTVNDSWDMTCDLRAQYLARHGYVVFRLDNRGTPRRGKAFETALAGRLGSVEVEDQVAGARWLASQGYVDPKRVGIYGWSYGGYMAARCVLQAPEVFRAAVVGAPVSDWDGYDTHYTERYMGRPQDRPDAYRTSSILPLADRLERPILILHGMVDENVHFRHTARLMNALNGAQKRYELLVFPDERHLPRGEADRRYLESRLVEFFDRNLK